MNKFTDNIQNKTKEKLNICIETASDITKGKDLISQFFDCYKDLLKDYSDMQIKISNEFNNII